MQSKFTKKERLEIGRMIYEGKLNQEDAAVKYDINPYTARDYLRLYKAVKKMKEKKVKSYEHQKSRAAVIQPTAVRLFFLS